MPQPNDPNQVMVIFTAPNGATSSEVPMSPEEADAAIATMLILHPEITANTLKRP